MRFRLLLLALIALIVALIASGCDSGGGGGGEFAPAAVWGQYRHDNQRTGMGIGIIQEDDAIVDFEIVDPPSPDGSGPSAISGSPAIDADSRIYIGTEGGTLASFDSGDDINRRWTVNRCGVCPAGQQHLGPLVSSPAVYTYEDVDGLEHTSIFLGSVDNAVFLYEFDQGKLVDESSCEICFWRGNAALQAEFLADDSGATVNAAFLSSPTFTANLGTGSIAGIFIGARITIEHSDGSREVQGKLYAINQDGSLRWQYPRAGDPPIGPITSSPAFAVGQTLFFTTDADPLAPPGTGDILYALTEGGNLKRAISIAGLTDPQLLLSPSPMTSATVYINSVDGMIHAMNPDGTFLWNASIPGERLNNSMIVGSQNEETQTPEPDDTPTPTGTLVEPSITSTPTPTETPLRLNSTVLGVTESGMLFVIDSSNGNVIPPTGRRPAAAVTGTVAGSPVLSGDLFVVFGTTGGQLFSLDTATGQLPRFCSGGQDDGNLCTSDLDCSRFCKGGENDGDKCDTNADCVGGLCPASRFCNGGQDDGDACTTDRDCVDGDCVGGCDDSFWPLLLPRSCTAGENRSRFCLNDDECPGGTCVRPAIRSSAAIDLDGTIYFGADDGRIYAVDVNDEITPRPTMTPTATPPFGATHTRTVTPATVPRTVTPTVTPTAGEQPTATETVAPSPSPTESETELTEPTATETAVEQPTATETVAQSPSPTESETELTEPTATETPVELPSPTPVDTVTAEPTAFASPTAPS